MNERLINILRQAGLLNDGNRALVAAHTNPWYFSDALVNLLQAGILNQDNFLLVSTQADPSILAAALCRLKEAQILTDANRDLVASHVGPEYLAAALCRLQGAQILTDANRDLVASHVSPKYLASALCNLQGAGILTEANRALVAAHTNPWYLAAALGNLLQVGILNQYNFNLVAAQTDPSILAAALCNLQGAGILTKANRTLVTAHTNPWHLAYMLGDLLRAGMLNQDNFTLVAAHAFPQVLSYKVFSLHKAGILNQCNFAIFAAAHTDPARLTDAIGILQRARMLTDANRALVVAHVDPPNLAEALGDLEIAGMLTDANRALVAAHVDPSNLAVALCNLQGAEMLTDANRALVAAHVDPSSLACTFDHLQQAGILNQVNSESIAARNHVTLVSEKALRIIWARIPRNLLTQANFQRLLTAAEHVNPMAALERVRDQILGVYAEVGHDTALNPGQSTHTASVHRSGSDSALKLMRSYGLGLVLKAKFQEIKSFVNGLSYAHQAPERCIAGITADAYSFTDYYITHEVALFKLPKLAAEHAHAYLQTLPVATANDYRKVKELVEGLKSDKCLALIWEHIRGGVQTALWDEFNEAYAHNPSDARFLALIENGQYLPLPDLSAVETTLLASTGYQALLEEQMRLSLDEQRGIQRLAHQSLWVNRNESTKAREDFDQQYGLILKP